MTAFLLQYLPIVIMLAIAGVILHGIGTGATIAVRSAAFGTAMTGLGVNWIISNPGVSFFDVGVEPRVVGSE